MRLILCFSFSASLPSTERFHQLGLIDLELFQRLVLNGGMILGDEQLSLAASITAINL
jgi:hypothetical protein